MEESIQSPPEQLLSAMDELKILNTVLGKTKEQSSEEYLGLLCMKSYLDRHV